MNREQYLIGDLIRSGLNIVNLFCGGGGVSSAFANLGLTETIAIDYSSVIEKVFTFNFKDERYVPFWKADIGSLTPTDILRRTLLQKGETHVAVVTAPCPGVSVAKGFIDSLDERNGLLLHSVDLFEGIMPMLGFWENVPGLLDPRATAISNELNLRFIEKLAPHYNIRRFKLKASMYNVPQIRERLIWVLYRKDLEIIPTRPEPEHDLMKNLTIGSIDPSILAVKVGQSKKTLKLGSNRILNTLTASEGGTVVYYRDGTKGKLTKENLLKFATFPSWYGFPEDLKYSDAHLIAGNCVPANFAQKIIEHILMETGHKLLK